MVGKAKNLTQRLTSEDKVLLEKVVTKYIVKYYSLTQQYPNPKKYVEKMVLKQVHSDEAIASLYTILYAIDNPSHHVLFPGEINERLANDIGQTVQQDSDTIDSFHRKRFLHPRDLREKVLRNLESDDILLRLEGKKVIANYQNMTISPGKKPQFSRSQNERGGRWSGYKATREIEKLKRVMDKPEALDFLYEKTVRTELAHKLAKFIFLIILHAIKMDEKVIQMIGFGASFFHSTITEKDTNDYKTIHQTLQVLDDNQLEQAADGLARSAIENKGYYVLLFFTGLLKL